MKQHTFRISLIWTATPSMFFGHCLHFGIKPSFCRQVKLASRLLLPGARATKDLLA